VQVFLLEQITTQYFHRSEGPKNGPQGQKSMPSSRHLQKLVITIGQLVGSFWLILGVINILCREIVFVNVVDVTFWNKIVITLRF